MLRRTEKKGLPGAGGLPGRLLLFLLLAAGVCFVLGGGIFLTVPVGGRFLSPSVFLRAAALTALYEAVYRGRPGRRRFRIAALFGAVMAFLTLLGLHYSLDQTICVSPAGLPAAFGALTFVYGPAICLLLTAADRGFSTAAGRRELSVKRGASLGCWLFFMAISWCVYLPVFLAVYPGIYSYDASVQVLQLFGGLPLSTHHPLAHTFYLGACLKAGEFLFGSYQAGMAIHSLTQSFFVSSVFSFVLCWMCGRGMPRWLLAVSWLYLVLNPYQAVFSFVTTKDVIFGAFFLLAFDLACDLAAAPEAFFQSRGRVAAFFGAVFFMCLFRNQGIYVYLFFAVLFLAGTAWRRRRGRKGIWNRNGNGRSAALVLAPDPADDSKERPHWRRRFVAPASAPGPAGGSKARPDRRRWFAALGSAPGSAGDSEARSGWRRRFVLFSLALTAAWYVCAGPLPAALGAEMGDSREMLCVPMQQLARAYQERPEALTPEEISYIETLIDPTALDAYVRVNADPVKNGFRTEVLREDPGRFLKTWAGIGLRLPEVYADSFLMGNWGYWYPGASQYWIGYILFDGAFLEGPYNVLHITRDTRFPALADWLRSITLTPAQDEVPLLRFVLNQAFPFWLWLAAAAALLDRRRFAMLAPLSLFLGYWGTLLLGPVVSLRYVLPLIDCVPLLAEIFLYADAGRMRRQRP